MRKKHRVIERLIAFFAAAIIASSMPVESFAMTNNINVIYTEVNEEESSIFVAYSVDELFDMDYYLMLYPDVEKAFGRNRAAALNHYLKCGFKEGRQCSPYLNLTKYVDNYPDLQSAFADNLDLYVAHYFICGRKEGRCAFLSDFDTIIQKKIYTYLVAVDNQFNIENQYKNGQLLTLTSEVRRKLYAESLFENAILQAKKNISTEEAEDISIENQNASSSNSTSISRNNNSDSPIIIIPVEPDENNSDENNSDDNSSDGPIIVIPWDYVENGYITLEMIQEHCGDNLLLVQDSNNNVKFIAGDISSKKVNDYETALVAINAMYGVLNFPEDTCYLQFDKKYIDSEGNVLYRFYSYDIETGVPSLSTVDAKLNTKTSIGTINIKSDAEGNILSISSTSPELFNSFILRDGKDIRNEIVSVEDCESLLEKIKLKDINYVGYEDELYRVFYALAPGETEDENEYCKIYINYDGEITGIFKIDTDIYLSTNGAESEPYDYLYANVEVEYRDFLDYYGRIVSLPVALDKETGKHYFAYPDYKIVMLANGESDDSSGVYTAALSPFFIEDFKDEDDLVKADKLKNAVTIFSNSLATCNVYYADNRDTSWYKPIILNYCYNNVLNNAYAVPESMIGIFTFGNDGNSFTREFDTASHELTHTFVFLNNNHHVRAAFDGAIMEGYADIIGLMIQQKEYMSYLNVIAAEQNISLEEAAEYARNNESGCWDLLIDDWVVGGKTAYLYKASDPYNTAVKEGQYSTRIGDDGFDTDPNNDIYNSHGNAAILTHVAYRMWTDVEGDLDKLMDIWIDTIPYLNTDTSFYDIRYFVQAIMQEKNYSEEQIAATMEIFDDANITKETQDCIIIPDDRKITAADTDESDPILEAAKMNEVLEELNDEFDDEFNEEFTEELKEEFTEELKEEFTEELKEEFTEDSKEEFTEELKEEFTEELKEEFTEELKEEFTEELKEEFTEELKEEFTEELKEEFTEELKEEFTKDLNEEITDEIDFFE